MTRLPEALSPMTISRPPEAGSTLFSIIASENPFRNQWYAVAPVADLPQDRPYGIELFNTPLVVFFDKAKGTWHCLLDRCKHRCASLSCGTVSEDGVLTCLFHGWQYDGRGHCVGIPSLANLPKNNKFKVDHFATHIQAKILWVFAGDPEAADLAKVPPTPWGDPDFEACLFVRDTEFDWLIYNEHNMDRHHVKTSHPETLKRLPEPVGAPVRVKDSGREAVRGFQYTQALKTSSGERYSAPSAFYPPATTIAMEDRRGRRQGICFTVTPLAYGRCRVIFLLFRAPKLPAPHFLLHITFARVTEEDAILVRSQMQQLAHGDRAADEAFVSVPTDNVARDYRTWLRNNGGLFWQCEVNQHVKDYSAVQARTLAKASASIYEKWEGNMHLASRYSQHFKLCRTCQRAYRRFSLARLCSLALAALILGPVFSAGITSGWSALGVPFMLACGGGAWLCDHMMRVLKGQRF